MADISRIRPQQARQKLKSGDGALLVCAYDSDEKFQANHLGGAIPLSEFRALADSIPKDRDIYFYCR